MTTEPTSTTAAARAALSGVLARGRRRWRAVRVLVALDAAVVLAAFAALLAVGAMDLARFEAAAVDDARVAFYAFAGIVLVACLALALRRRPSEREIAARIEARAPELDALLLSAVEVDDAPVGRVRSPALDRRLVEQAARAASRRGLLDGIDRRALHRAGAAGLALLATLAAVALFGPARLQHGVAMLLMPSGDPALGNPYTVVVRPGDAAVLEGEDLRVVALPAGFDPASFVLVLRPAGDTAWERRPMAPIRGDEGFDAFVFDLSGSFDYYAEAGDVRSATHRVEVIPRARVERIDLRYEYPRYTGLAPREVTGGGDIRAVTGTRVEIGVLASSAVEHGEIVLDGGRRVTLRLEGERLTATIDVTEDGRYRVELPAGDAGLAPASPAYAIVALEDRPPTVSLVNPGRDARVTSIEEIEISARAEDDLSVRGLELVISVNGGEEEVVALGGETGDATAIGGSHLLYLEDRGLAPGDLIAFYARARDGADESRPSVATDMYFLDIRPFEQNFRRAQGGQQGAGGGRQQEQTLAAQQRSLVVALFKLLRDRDLIHEALLGDRVGTLRAAQSRIRERTDAIVRRLGSRDIVRLTPAYRTMAEELPRAGAAMLEVEALLAVRDLDGSMPAARKALLHLQRADAAFRDVQIAQSRQGGGGAAANELADLFQLEMDRFRSPYETLQRGRQEAASARLDETLRKLEELARRQQREIERARRRAERGGGSSGAGSQSLLAQEVEDLLRKLEKLSRQRDPESLAKSMRELREAANEMRESGQRGESQAGERALERLRQAREALDSADGPAQTARAVEETRDRADALAREQRDIGAALDRLRADGEPDRERVAPIREREADLGESLTDLERRIARIAAGTRDDAPRVGRALGEAARGARADEIGKRIDAARERLREDPQADVGRDLDAVAQGLEALRGRLDRAARIAGTGGRDARAAERLRGTLRALEGERERLDERRLGGPLVAGAGNPDRLSAADLADLRQALDARLPALEALADQFRDDARVGREVDALVEAIRRARDAGGDDSLVTRQVALLEALKRLELGVRPDTPDRAARVASAPPGETPPEHREAIEAFYRDLSERSTR